MNWNFWLHTKISIAFPVVVVKEGGPTKLVIEDWMDHLTLQGLLTLLTSSGKEATIYVRKKGKRKNLICSAVSSRDGLNGKGVGGGLWKTESNIQIAESGGSKTQVYIMHVSRAEKASYDTLSLISYRFSRRKSRVLCTW